MELTAPVSVVIPSYNYGHFLPFAINSVLAQTLPPDEIIVVDDGSTDKTSEVVASFGARVRYIYKENAGLPAARNTGIQNAKNRLIGFLDADDIWCPRFLEVCLAKLGDSVQSSQTEVRNGSQNGLRELNLEYGVRDSQSAISDPEHHTLVTSSDCVPYSLVATSRKFIDGNGAPLPQGKAAWAKTGRLDHRDILLKTRFSPSAVLANKDCLIRAGLFDESLRSSEDRDMWIRMTALSPAFLIDEPLVQIRRHGNNMSRNADRMKQNILKVLKKSRVAGLVAHNEWSFWLRAWSFAHFQSAWMYYEQGMRFRSVWNNLVSCALWPFYCKPQSLGEPCMFRLRSFRIFLFCSIKS